MASLAAVTEPAASAVPGGMPATWLRDNCPCALCRDPVSGQRLLPITDIPADMTVAEVIASPGPLMLCAHVPLQPPTDSTALVPRGEQQWKDRT